MRSRILLDIVVRESMAVLEMLAGENNMLSIREGVFLINGEEGSQRTGGGVDEE